MNATSSKTDVPPMPDELETLTPQMRGQIMLVIPEVETAAGQLPEAVQRLCDSAPHLATGPSQPSRANRHPLCRDLVMPASTSRPVDAAKAELKRDFPDWNIVRSSEGRWWAFFAPDRRKSRPDVKDVDLDADTAAELHTKLTAAES
ncbi:DUF6415 family natural product biosynthesis protein [Spirillospora sp. CA-142024]|uniref:DUF6415 family natural product biosynthesis protein n=1 Tax=Spirillospora sp. CA-142024 TaxID=3240036 RepID=UPI003D89CC39